MSWSTLYPRICDVSLLNWSAVTSLGRLDVCSMIWGPSACSGGILLTVLVCFMATLTSPYPLRICSNVFKAWVIPERGRGGGGGGVGRRRRRKENRRRTDGNEEERHLKTPQLLR